MTLEITLPWPPSILWPNRSIRAHWAVKGKAAAKYRHDCLVNMPLMRFIQNYPLPTEGKIHLTVSFCAPTRRRFDLDGALSAIKQGIDALAERLGVDDSRFIYTIDRGEPVKGGKVVIDTAQVIREA